MLTATGFKSCFFIGCLGVPALLIGGCMVFWGVAATLDPPVPEPERVSREHELPEPTAGDDEARGLGAAENEIGSAATGAVGTIHLDVSMAELIIEPGESGEPIRLEADYDAAYFDLREELTTTEGGWHYELTYDNKVSLFRFMKGRVEESGRLYLTLPPGQPFALEGSIDLAQSELELGGLAVRSVDLELGAGDHRITFSDPTPSALSLFAIDGSFGEVRLDRIGNGSPHLVRLEHSAGSLGLDLEGDWRNDGEVRVKFGFGECSIDLPRDIPVRVESARVRLGERRIRSDDLRADGADDRPTISIWARGTAGELTID